MRISKQLTVMTGLFLAGGVAWNTVFAQAQVVDAGAGQSQPQQQQPAATSNGQNEVIVNMYLQLEALQSEIQNLRGLVEEQSYQIRRMETEQRDRYLDTDSRISELYNQVQSSGGGQGVAQQTPPATAPGQTNRAPTTSPPAGSRNISQPAVDAASPQNEQELYRQALGLLLEAEEYEDSITLFQQYIDVYPAGRYLTNALYWQGAAFDLVGQYNQAITVLQRLVQEFPNDPKAPTAMLRLGTVYREMGNMTLAAENWRRIGEVYPDSASEIELANEYLIEISN